MLYSFARILDENLAFDGAVDLAFFDLANSRRVDDLTVELAMRQPIADLPSTLAGFTISVVQDGARDFSAPVGTGPFTFESFRPGERAVYTRNENYWQEGQPYLDQLEVLTIVDVNTRYNALLGGEVEIAADLSPVHVRSQENSGDFGLLQTPIRTMRSFLLRLDQPPFTDELVREAFKYAVDRQALVDSVYLGYGEIANDLYGKAIPSTTTSCRSGSTTPSGRAPCCARPAWRGSRCPPTPLTWSPACSSRRRCSSSRRANRASR